MKGLEEFLHWLQGTMEVPKWFGWYHIMWICFMIAACVLIYIFRKKFTKRGINITLLTIGIALIILEIYKQVIYSFNYNSRGGEFFVVISMVCLSFSILFYSYVPHGAGRDT